MKKHTACIRLANDSWVKITSSDIQLGILGKFYRALGVKTICIPEALADYSGLTGEELAKVPHFDIEPDHDEIRDMLEEEGDKTSEEWDEDDEHPDGNGGRGWYESRDESGKKVMRRC